jgi:hypothetical protein
MNSAWEDLAAVMPDANQLIAWVQGDQRPKILWVVKASRHELIARDIALMYDAEGRFAGGSWCPITPVLPWPHT